MSQVRQWRKNKGERLSSLYGCGDLHLPKGEMVIRRKDISPDNSYPSLGGGWIGEKCWTNKDRCLTVIYNYMTGKVEVQVQ